MVILTAVLIVLIVTTGVLSRFLLDEFTSRIVLISLIIFLSILGLSALAYLEVRKRTVAIKNQKALEKNGYLYRNIEPSAPRDSDWEYSNRTTMPSS